MSLKHHLLVLLAMCPTSWCWNTAFKVRMGIRIQRKDGQEKCSEGKVKQILRDTLEELVATEEYITSLHKLKKEGASFKVGQKVKSLERLTNNDDATQNVQVGDPGEVMEVNPDGTIVVLFAGTKTHVEAGQIWNKKSYKPWKLYVHRFKFTIDTLQAKDGSKFVKKLEEWIEKHHENAFEHPILQNRSDEHTLFIELKSHTCKTQEALAKRLRSRRAASKEENAEVLDEYTLTFNSRPLGFSITCIEKVKDQFLWDGAKVNTLHQQGVKCDERLHTGDRILKINGQDVRNWNYYEIEECALSAEAPLTMTFEAVRETQGPPRTVEADRRTTEEQRLREAEDVRVRKRESEAKRLLRKEMEGPKECKPVRRGGSKAHRRRSSRNDPYTKRYKRNTLG